MAYLVTGLWLLTGYPSVAVDYVQVINRKAAVVPGEQQAWPIYRQAMQMLVAEALQRKDEIEGFNEYYPLASAFPAWTNGWVSGAPTPGDADWPAARKWLEEHEEVLSLVRQGAARPGLGFKIGFAEDLSPEDRHLLGFTLPASKNLPGHKKDVMDRVLIGVPLEHIQHMRNMARILAADSRRAVTAGDGAAALANVYAMLGLSRQSEETPMLVCGLVAISLNNMAIQTIEHVLSSQAALWSDSQLQELAAR